jgi:hypothetical protein
VVDVTSDVLATQARHSQDVLIRRAEEVCSEARRLQEQTRRQIAWMMRTLPR